MEHRFGRDIFACEFRVAAPANFNASEQISFRPGKLEQARGFELRIGAKNFRIRGKGYGGAAPVGGGAKLLQLTDRMALREALAIQLLVAGNFDNGIGRQGVDHRHTDAMQSAGCRISLVRELTAGVQGRQNDLKRRFVRKFGMRINRNAAAIVGDGQPVANAQMHFNTAGMAGDGFIHRVVEDFGREMVQGAFVDAANIHARATANRLKPLQHFNCRSGIIIGCGSGGRAPAKQVIGHNNAIGAGELAAQQPNETRLWK